MGARRAFYVNLRLRKKGSARGGGGVLRLRLANPMLKLRAIGKLIATLMSWGT